MACKFLNDDFRLKGNEGLSSGSSPRESNSDASFIAQPRPSKFVHLLYTVQLATSEKTSITVFLCKDAGCDMELW